MAISTAVILFASMSCLVGFGGAASVPGNFELFGPVKQCDCDCECPSTFYYKSQNAAAFTTAEGDCKRLFGEDAHLIYVETQPEIANVIKFLDNDDSGTFYWTGGLYNAGKKQFEWKSGVPFEESWSLWAPGQPANKNPVTKVLLTHVAGLGLEFSTVLDTESRRYICEFQE